MTDLDALEKLAREAAALDHNEAAHWYTEDELLVTVGSARDVIHFPKNARLIAAASPNVVLRLVAVARAAGFVATSNGFDAALPDKMGFLRQAWAELRKPT